MSLYYEITRQSHPDRLKQFVKIIQTVLSLPILFTMGVTTVDFGQLRIVEVISDINGRSATVDQSGNRITIQDGDTVGVFTDNEMGFKVMDFNRPEKNGGAHILSTTANKVNTDNDKFDVRGKFVSTRVDKGETVTIPGTDIKVTSS